MTKLYHKLFFCQLAWQNQNDLYGGTVRNTLILFKIALKGLWLTNKKKKIVSEQMKTKDEAPNENETLYETPLGTGKTYTSRRSRQSLQFDLQDGNIRRFAKVMAELQNAGVNFQLHQTGDTIWIDFDVQWIGNLSYCGLLRPVLALRMTNTPQKNMR